MPVSHHHIISASLLLAALQAVPAQETPIVGPRTLGMGGAGVAVADDQNVQWQNPAALGFFGRSPIGEERLKGDGSSDERVSWVDNNHLGRKDFGLGFDSAIGVRFEDQMRDRILQFAKDVDEIDRISDRGISSQSDLDTFVRVVNNLDKLDDGRNAVFLDANSGVGLRIGHFGLGVRSFSEGSFRVRDVDTVNLGLAGLAGAALASQINNSGAASDGTVQLFSPVQQAELRNLLGGDAAAQAALERIDFQARQQGLTQADIDRLYPYITSTAGALGGSLKDNTTALRGAFLNVVEVPVSYGIALNQYVSVGFNLKYMLGTVGAAEVRVKSFAEDSGDSDKYEYSYKRSSNWGVDLAVMGRWKWVQGGLLATNLNAPKFEAPSDIRNGIRVDDVTIDPQLRAGLAFIPFETFAITGDIDLLQTKAIDLGTKQQRAGAGVEWNILRFLAIRGGVSQNIAVSSAPVMYHAGLGLDLWLLRFDLAGSIDQRSAEKFDTYLDAVASGTELKDMEELPEAAKVSFQVAIDF